MPVVYGNYTKQLKLLPITMYANGTASVEVRYGFVNESGNWNDFSSKTIHITQDEVNTILDTFPTTGLSRRDDLSLAVYQFLVKSNYIESGEIV